MPPKKSKFGRKAVNRKPRPSKPEEEEELTSAPKLVAKDEPFSPSNKKDENGDPTGATDPDSEPEKDEAKKEPESRAALKCTNIPEEPLCRGGRLSKISARSKMKEIVYKEEPLTPESDGFESQQRRVTPSGIRRPGQSKLKRGRGRSSIIASKKGKIENKTIIRKRRPKIGPASVLKSKSLTSAPKPKGTESKVTAKKEPSSPLKDGQSPANPSGTTDSDPLPSNAKENENAEPKPGTSGAGSGSKSSTVAPSKKDKVEKKTVIRKRRPKAPTSSDPNAKSSSKPGKTSQADPKLKIEPCSPTKDKEASASGTTGADSGPAPSTSTAQPSENAENESTSTATQSNPANPPQKKSFFRGRRSKISARSGRKEVVYKEEPINPEDIAGFEHVEKFVTPQGIKLPKFWDSEDELSDDDTNDNFRRIMCGFGVNCRIHDVIRPTSEIVRRMKELQNTFGSSKTLPLFLKDGSTGPEPSMDDVVLEEDRGGSSAAGGQVQIHWHTDPKYFQYANNFP